MRAKIVAVHHVPFVTNNDGPSLAVRQSPVDNIFTKWSTGGLDVTVTITRDIAILAAIVDVDHPSRSLDSRFFPVEPAELFHDNSFWSRVRLRFLADWSVSSPMALGKTLVFAMQRLIYISIIEHAVKRSPTKIAVKPAPLALSLIFLKVSLQPGFHGVLFECDEIPYMDYPWEYASLKDF